MQPHRNQFTKFHRRENGFSAIEMLITVGLLMAVLGVVVKGMTEMQRRNFSETTKMDSVQDARDFTDQMVRDIHMVGYPPPGATTVGQPNPITNPAGPYCTDSVANGAVNVAVRMNPKVACGIVAFSPTNVVYEGDLDGSGSVSVVFLNLVPGAGNNCPCTLQRGVVPKAIWAANPANYPVPGLQYFTTVNGVLNSGNGAGGSIFPLVMGGPGNYISYKNADVFDAYDALANPINPVVCSLGTPGNPGTSPDCSQIRSLQITINVAPAYADPTTKQFPVYAITSKARINF